MKLIDELQKRYTITAADEKRADLSFLTVKQSEAVSLLTELRDLHGFSHLSFLTAVDYPEDRQFQLTYLLHNYPVNSSLGVRVFIDRETAEMHSTHHLWEQAKTYQRELKEMFGINFPGSPGVDDSFILEGWQGIPPMRRDFDSKKYSDETYFPRPGRKTEDPRDHMQKNLYPDYKKFEDDK